jgi:hypothetical protein
MERHQEHDGKKLDDKEIKDSQIDGFDDVIIKQTNERLNQEFSNLSSLETKAGILIAAIAAILTITFTGLGITQIVTLVKQNFYGFIPVIVSVAFFALSFVIPLVIIIPRTKLELLDPRTINNELYQENNLDEVKKQIKHNLITSFEEIEKIRNKETFAIKCSFIFLGLGSLCLIILHILPPLQ